jgi:hypothetical protein
MHAGAGVAHARHSNLQPQVAGQPYRNPLDCAGRLDDKPAACVTCSTDGEEIDLSVIE